MKIPHRSMLVAGVAILVSTTLAAPAQSSEHHTWKVEPGTGTISAAVDKASPGDTLSLQEGTFYDSVLITKSLTVKGAGWSNTVLKPPPSSDNICNSEGGMSGLCVLGKVDSQMNPDFSQPVKDVTISRLHVTGFADTGVLGFNTDRMVVRHVRSDHNNGYGIARFASVRSDFSENWASWNGEAGLYLGDSPDARSSMNDNMADHNGIGVFLRDSTRAQAEHNRSWGNCVGILALNSGHEAAFWDKPAGYLSLRHNTVWDNTMACPGGEHPALSGTGIGLFGVTHTAVTDNEVNRNWPTGDTTGPGGIVVASTSFLGGVDATNNTVRHNHLTGNLPADVLWDANGTGNVVGNNHCGTAIPGNLGWCSH